MRRLIGSVTVLTVLIAVACGGEDSPTPTVAQGSRGGAARSHVNRGPGWQRWVRGHGCPHVNRGQGRQRWIRGHGCPHVNRSPGQQHTSTVAPDSSGRSDLAVAEVAEYAAWCVEWQVLGEPDPDLTWGQGAESFSEVVDAYENKSAPEELKALHDAVAAF